MSGTTDQSQVEVKDVEVHSSWIELLWREVIQSKTSCARDHSVFIHTRQKFLHRKGCFAHSLTHCTIRSVNMYMHRRFEIFEWFCVCIPLQLVINAFYIAAMLNSCF